MKFIDIALWPIRQVFKFSGASWLLGSAILPAQEMTYFYELLYGKNFDKFEKTQSKLLKHGVKLQKIDLTTEDHANIRAYSLVPIDYDPTNNCNKLISARLNFQPNAACCESALGEYAEIVKATGVPIYTMNYRSVYTSRKLNEQHFFLRKLLSQKDMLEDVKALFKYVRDIEKHSPGKIEAHGFSIGGNAAAVLAGWQRKGKTQINDICWLTLERSFDNITNVILGIFIRSCPEFYYGFLHPSYHYLPNFSLLTYLIDIIIKPIHAVLAILLAITAKTVLTLADFECYPGYHAAQHPIAKLANVYIRTPKNELQNDKVVDDLIMTPFGCLNQSSYMKVKRKLYRHQLKHKPSITGDTLEHENMRYQKQQFAYRDAPQANAHVVPRDSIFNRHNETLKDYDIRRIKTLNDVKHCVDDHLQFYPGPMEAA